MYINSYSRLKFKTYVKMLNVIRQCAWVEKKFFSIHQRLNKEHPNNKHSYPWLVGLTDGAGFFNIKNLKGHWYFIFKIIVPRYNIRMLYYVKHLLGIGSVIKDDTKAQFSIKDRIKMQNFVFLIFDQYPLLTYKRFIYDKFKEAYFILDDNNLTKEEKDSNISNLMFEIRNIETMLDATYSYLNCSNDLINAMTISWVVGFIEVRGMFYLERSATSPEIVNVFRIQTLDGVVLEALRSIFHIHNKVKYSKECDYYILETANSRAIKNIINLLQGKLKGMKALSFKLWSRGYIRRDNERKITKIQTILKKVESNLSYSLGCETATRNYNSKNMFICSFQQKSKFSTSRSVNLESNNFKLLNPFYVTGFCDAESSFIISVTKRPNYKTGWGIYPVFKIELHIRDLGLLEKIQTYFDGVGNITTSKTENCATYAITSKEEINTTLLPHFDKYKLLTNKQVDYILFKSVLELINKGEHLTKEGIIKILAIKASINSGSIPDVFVSEIVPIIRPDSIDVGIVDPYWFSGFIEGEGCFFIDIFKSKTHKIGYQVKLKFQITQHSRDYLLMKSFENYLECGITREVVKRPAYDFVVNKFSDIEDKIIPLFKNRPLQGVKALDLEDFCKVVSIIKTKEHLTPQGL